MPVCRPFSRVSVPELHQGSDDCVHPAPNEPGGAGNSGFRMTELAIGKTVILLHPPLPLTGVSIGMQKGSQQNDILETECT